MNNIKDIALNKIKFNKGRQMCVGNFDGEKEAKTAYILVIGYDFCEDAILSRKFVLAADLEQISSTFDQGLFSCQIQELIGLKKEELITKLGEDIFQQGNGESVDILMVFVLSHGLENGIILTDTKENGDYEKFHKNEIFNKLAENRFLKGALQIFFMEPCRGGETERRFLPGTELADSDHTPVPQFTNETAHPNQVIFYSTFEKNVANYDNNGTWLVQTLCSEMNQIKGGKGKIEIFLTNVIAAMIRKSEPGGQAQTPEMVFYPHTRFTLTSNSNLETTEPREGFFSWATDAGENLGQGRAFVFYDEEHSVFANEFETCFSDHVLNVHKFKVEHIDTELAKVAKYLDKEDGMIMVCTLTKLIYSESGFAIPHSGQDNISDVTGHFTSAKCPAMVGKPQVYLFLDSNIRSDSTNNTCQANKITNCGNNNADCLSFIGKGYAIIAKILSELKDMVTGRSLQEVFCKALNVWKSGSGGEMPKVVSTMPYLLDFPKIGSLYMKPTFTVKRPGHVKKNDDVEIPYEVLTLEVLKIVQSSEDERSIFVLTSEPGTGKTRMTQELTKFLLGKQINVVKIEAKNCEDYFSVFDDFKSIVNAYTKKEVKDFDKAALLLDGVDEILNSQEEVMNFVKQASKTVPFLLITTRPHVKEALDQLLRKHRNVSWLTINEFHRLEVDLFMHRLLKDVDNWRETWSIIRDQNDFTSWPPLLLHLLAELLKNTENRDDLIENVDSFGIYWKLTDQRIQHIVKNRTTKKGVKSLEVKLMLMKFTCWSKLGRKKKMPKVDKDVINKLGLAYIDGRKMSFMHLTFSDFLLCCALMYGGKDLFSLVDIAKILLEPRYESVRRFLDNALMSDFTAEGCFSSENFIKKKYLLKILKRRDFQSDFIELVCSEGLFGLFKKLVNRDMIPDLDVNQLLISTCDLVTSGHVKREQMALELLDSRGADIYKVLESHNDQWQLMTVISRFSYCELLKKLPPHLILPDLLNTGLLITASYGHTECFKLLHQQFGADINVESSEGWNVLHYAAQSGNVELVQWLLQYKDVNSKTNEGKTPLYIAARGGHIAAALVLLNAGADLNAKDYKFGWNVLHCAARRGSSDLVQLFLKKGLDVNQVATKGETPLLLAAEGGHDETFLMLVDNGAKVEATDHRGWNAIHFATCNSVKERIFDFLPMSKLDVNARAKDGKTPILVACQLTETGALRRLLNMGASPTMVDEKGFNALHYAVQAGRERYVKILVSEVKLDVNAATKDGRTPLHFAENTLLYKYLIKNGADNSIANNAGKKPVVPVR